MNLDEEVRQIDTKEEHYLYLPIDPLFKEYEITIELKIIISAALFVKLKVQPI